MYSTTGFRRDEIVDLCVMIHTEPVEDGKMWPPILGLFKSVVIALTYLRRNRMQCELAETYGVSQPTVSRAITAVTPLLAHVLVGFVPTRSPSSGTSSTGRRNTTPQVNKIRYVIEQVIANLKTWRILHTDYRRPFATFAITISAVVALHFYRLA